MVTAVGTPAQPWRCITPGLYDVNVWEVDLERVEPWLGTLSDDDYEQVIAAVELLREHGPTLGRPLVDTVSGSDFKNMKELRPGSSGRSEIRILFAFDPDRKAIVLVGGDKAGRWKTWYRKAIPAADRMFESHLKKLKEQ